MKKRKSTVNKAKTSKHTLRFRASTGPVIDLRPIRNARAQKLSAKSRKAFWRAGMDFCRMSRPEIAAFIVRHVEYRPYDEAIDGPIAGG